MNIEKNTRPGVRAMYQHPEVPFLYSGEDVIGWDDEGDPVVLHEGAPVRARDLPRYLGMELAPNGLAIVEPGAHDWRPRAQQRRHLRSQR